MNGHGADFQVTSPYPGLRPFEPQEKDLFFGRADQLDEMLAKLEVNRFLAVVGTSGCGKSSLVRAGLLPAMEDGFLSDAGPFWRMVIVRPADAPITSLAGELAKEAGLGKERGTDANARAMLQATLRRGRMGLVDTVRETMLPAGSNLLVVVDQFEELFRYHQREGFNQATAFVNLLLSAAQQQELSIYVVITMRSDFLGDCSIFEGLPEAINESQFLTPRLTRDQLRDAIVGPAKMFRCTVEPAVLNRILNDIGTDPDQLPLMQHALMRMWWNVKDRIDEGDDSAPTRGTIELADYEATGGLERALSIHANEAYDELLPAQKRIAEILFRCVTDISSDRRGTRRPIPLGNVALVADVEPAEVAEVVEVFRRPGRSFLTPPAGTPLQPETVLDISHESLIRQWDKLIGEQREDAVDQAEGWLHQEAESASIYHRLSQTAGLWREDKAGLWGTPDLELALDWREREQPTAAWAERYGGGYQTSMEFLDASEAARHQQLIAEERAEEEKGKEQRRRRRLLVSIAGAVLIAVVGASAGVVSYTYKQSADQNAELAEKEKVNAERERENAEKEKVNAEKEKVNADRSAYNAQLARFPEVWRNDPSRGLAHLEEQEREDLRDFTWRYYHMLALQSPIEVPNRVTPTGQPIALNAVAFASDGELLALAYADGAILIWKDATHAIRQLPTDHVGSVNAVAFSPVNRTLASAGDDGIVRLWDVDTLEMRRSLEANAGSDGRQRIRSLSFSPNGLTLAAAGDDETIRLWNVETGDERQPLRGHDDWVSAVTFVDNSTLASASYDETVRLWNVKTGECWKTLERHAGAVYSVAFSANDAEMLVSAGEDGTVRLWDLKQIRDVGRSQPRETLAPQTGAIYSVAYDGTTLASANEDSTATLWEVRRGKKTQIRQTLTDHLGPVNSVSLSPVSNRFASAGSDGRAFVRDATSENEIARSSEGPVQSLVASPVGKAFASISQEGVVKVWSNIEDASQQPVQVGPATQASCVALSPDGRTLAWGRNATVTLWDWQETTSLETPFETHADEVTALAFKNENVLAVGFEDGTIEMWNVQNQQKLAWPEEKEQEKHTDKITSLAFRPDGSMLASASADQKIKLWDIKLWDVETGRLAWSPAEPEGDWVLAVAFSPDGKTLAAACESQVIKLWNVEEELDSSKSATQPLSLTGHRLGVTSLAFAPDGKTLASGSMDGAVMLWDPLLGDWRATLRGHTGPVRSVAFQSDGALLASGGDDGTIRLWIASPEPTAGTVDPKR